LEVGFIGIGRMGTPMANNVAEAGFELAVFDKLTERAETLAGTGARPCASPAEVADGSHMIVTMLNDPAAVEEALMGERGVLSGSTPGQVIVDMSTVGPDASRRFAKAAEEKDLAFLDAPVSGSVSLAETADLVAMVGGPEGAFEKAEPVLAAMTKERIYLGPSGAGSAMKLAVNSLLAIVNGGIAEALTMAEKSGVERAQAYDVLASSVAGSPYAKYKRSQFLEAGAPVTFTTAQMQKDLSLALESTRRVALPAQLTAAANEMLVAASGLGYAEGDFASVVEVLRVLSGADKGEAGDDVG
jgi:3-hydroxyisobutyrate dehydrogenase